MLLKKGEGVKTIRIRNDEKIEMEGKEGIRKR